MFYMLVNRTAPNSVREHREGSDKQLIYDDAKGW